MGSRKLLLSVAILASILLAAYFFARPKSTSSGVTETTSTSNTEIDAPPPANIDKVATDAPANPTNEGIVATVKFTDGFELSVRFRDRPPGAPFDYWPPDVSFAHVYAGLVEKAESGDMHAAATLYYGAKGCDETYYDTEEKLYEGRNQILETNTIKMIEPRSGEVMVEKIDADSIDHWLSFVDQQYKRCRWVTDEMKSEKEHWKARAVDLGSPEIRRELANYARNTAAGRQLMLDVFHTGDYRIGSRLGSFLMGVRTPYADDTADPPSDPWQMQVEGYAYYYVSRLIMEADPTAPKSSRWKRAVDEEFQYFVSRLSPAAQKAGTERAKEILESYSQCCHALRSLSRLKD